MAQHENQQQEPFNRVVEASLKLLDVERRPVPRDQHPKHHGCVRAMFVIKNDLRAELKKGLFEKGGAYDAWIRFSNGRQRDDRKPDAHGMAIKLMGVDGAKAMFDVRDERTQDFVMVDHPVFFLRGVKQYAEFSDAVLKARGKKESALRNVLGRFLPERVCEPATLSLLYFFPWNLRTFARLRGFASSLIANPLDTRYWSTTAYRFGEKSMKFSAVPARFTAEMERQQPSPDASYVELVNFLNQAKEITDDSNQTAGNSPDYLKRAMSDVLRTDEHGNGESRVFVFKVQLYQSAAKTPPDDPTVEWLENDSRFYEVARIWIPPQNFQTEAREAFCENLSFTPWHALAAHQPLGEINEVRRRVYLELSTARHQANGVEPREPQTTDPDPGNLEVPVAWGDDPTAFSTVLCKELELIRKRRAKVEDQSNDAEGATEKSRANGEEAQKSIAPTREPMRVTDGRSSNASAQVTLSVEHAATARQPTAALPSPATVERRLTRSDEALAAKQAEPPVRSYRPGDEDARTKEFRLQALRDHVTGLAFSGGGIRSGTFAVGFLQGLASLGLIRRFDYLSTVSGGGYAGAWLAAWLRREGGDPKNVERMLSPNRVDQAVADRQYLSHKDVVDEEPEPLRHLRSYSSYLFPQPGIVSADLWTVILIWLRNVCINLLMLLPAGMLLVVAARLIVFAYHAFNPLEAETPLRYLIASLFTLVLGLSAAGLAYRKHSSALRIIRNRTDPGLSSLGTPKEVASLVNKSIVTPTLIAALFLTLSIRTLLWIAGDAADATRIEPATPATVSVSVSSIILDAVQSHLGLLEWPVFLLVSSAFGVMVGFGGWFNAPRGDPTVRLRFASASFIAGASGGILFVLLAGLIRYFARIQSADLMATFATPLAVLVVVAALIVLVALLGRSIDEAEREWWARLSALVTVRSLIWIGLMATILYVPGLFLAAGPWMRAAIASGWLFTAVFGVVTGRFVIPKVGGAQAVNLTTLAAVASQIFLVGLMGLVALVVSILANTPSPLSPTADDIGPFGYYIQGVNGASPITLVVIGVFSGVFYALARQLIDVNLFSLNAMYANRLTRCYLGASRGMSTWPARWSLPRDLRSDAGAPSLSHADDPVRTSNPLTGFDATDDIELRKLKIGEKDGNREYLGPHLLINTTLNLVGDNSLLRRDRKGESFLLSPLYCGSKGVGYAELGDTTQPGNVESNMTLGRAIAISGAAVDPNMSFYQSASLTALLTLFNARLGYWIEKPKPIDWTAKSPNFGNLILTEFFGKTDEHGDFVHISDGGHFENLGVYELIRRRCRYVVALDAGEDGDPSDESLANLIRLCRVDFGVRLKIDTQPLTMEGPDRLTRTHAVIGSIHYEDVDHGEMPGVFVYVKISLTGDEAPDLQKYARKDPRFPHQPTDLRQSFDEEQFECYRCLGDHIAREVFGDPVNQLREEYTRHPLAFDSQPHREYVPRLFAAVTERWIEAPEGMSELYVEANRGWSEIQAELAKSSKLKGLSEDLYPELKATGGKAGGGNRLQQAELHTVARMLATMENAWIGLSLNRTSTLPINRGWMNSFRRWVGSDAFRCAWPILRSECSAEFVRFCEEQLHMTVARPSVIRLPKSYGQLEEKDELKLAIDAIDDEFAREWPELHRTEQGGDRGPKGLITISKDLQSPPLVWLIVQAPSGPNEAKESPDRFACGVILAVKSEAPVEIKQADEGKPEPYELFVWIRRAYRSAGLGSACLQQVLPELVKDFPKTNGVTPPLWARYPKAKPGDDDIEFGNFLRFLSRFNFRPVEAHSAEKHGHSVLLSTSWWENVK